MELLIYSYVIGPLGVIGIVCNILGAVVLLRRDSSISDTSRFLLRMVLSTDTVYLVIVAVHVLHSFVLLHDQRSTLLGSTFFMVWMPYIYVIITAVYWTATMATSWFVVCLAASEYVTVYRPLDVVKYNTINWVRRAAVVIWIACVVLNIPHFLEFNIVTDSHASTITHTALSASRAYWIAYRIIFNSVVRWLLPGCLLAAFLHHLLRIVGTNNATHHIVSSNNAVPYIMSRENNGNDRFVVTLIVICVASIVCYVIDFVCITYSSCVFLLHDYYVPFQPYEVVAFYFNIFSNFLNVSLSSVKIIIYVVTKRTNQSAGLLAVMSCGSCRHWIQRLVYSRRDSSSGSSSVNYHNDSVIVSIRQDIPLVGQQ